MGSTYYAGALVMHNSCRRCPLDLRVPSPFVMQVMYDPSPSPPADRFSGEFRSFVDVCLLKEAEARPTAEQVRLLLVLLLY